MRLGFRLLRKYFAMAERGGAEMKTCADIMEMLSADFTTEYYHSFYGIIPGFFNNDWAFRVLLARRMQMISLAALMIYEGRW